MYDIDDTVAAPRRQTARASRFRQTGTGRTRLTVADSFIGRDRERVYRSDVPHNLPVSTLAR